MGIEGKAQGLGRLDSWKEIAGYFGRDERTVKRWEGRRGLPVYRAPGGGKTNVYAYVAELESWLRRDGDAAKESPTAGISHAGEPSGSGRDTNKRLWLPLAAGTAAMLGCLLFASLWIARAPSTPLSANAEANRYYRAGLYSWQTRTGAGLAQAIADFHKAIRVDSRFAAAYAGLADCYNLLPEYTATPASLAFPKAKAAAERAIALDDSLAAAHRSLAYVDFWWSRDIPAAMREFRQAIALEPRASQSHHWYANALSAMGDFPQALREIDTAQELEPGSTALMADKGVMLVDAGRASDGIQMLKQVENAQPQFAPAHAYLAYAYRSQRNGPGALRELRWHAQLTHDSDGLAVAAAGAAGYEAGGYGEMTRRIVAKEEKLFARGRLSPYALAVDCYRLGQTERALSFLTRAVDAHDGSAVAIRDELDLRGLYSDPRFAALVVKEGFALPKSM